MGTLQYLDATFLGLCCLISTVLSYKLLFSHYIRYVGAALVLVLFAAFKGVKIFDRFHGDVPNFVDLGESITNLFLVLMAYIYVRTVNKNG